MKAYSILSLLVLTACGKPSPHLVHKSMLPSQAHESMPHSVELPAQLENTDEYTDYGVQPFVQVAQDALSTFSVDVDTASYTQARARINYSIIPEKSSIRAEEFINYFDYHYAPPAQDEPFVVHMDSMNDPLREGHQIFRVGVQGKNISQAERPSLRLTFLVDVSGSMSSSNKLPLAQEAMHMLVDSLREDDSVALVTYAGSVRTILPATYGDDKKKIHKAIKKLKSGGGTAMSSGLELAYEQAWSSFKEGAENRVVVLSDGDANIGNIDYNQMLAQIKGYADRGVTMSTIGLGMGNYKDTRMEQLANKGDGNSYYIDSAEEAHKLFVEGFTSTMITIARDVKIQVEFNPNRVESYRLIGYENRAIQDDDFRNDRVDAGEVGAGHSVTALYQLKLKTEGAGAIAQTRLRYEAPGADKAATERVFESSPDLESPASSLKLAYAVSLFSEYLRVSPYVEGITIDQIIEYAKANVADEASAVKEWMILMEKVAILKRAPS